MSFEAIQQEIATWDEGRLRKLIACAVVLQDRREGRLAEKLSAKLDDHDPKRWVSIEEVDRQLGLGEADQSE